MNLNKYTRVNKIVLNSKNQPQIDEIMAFDDVYSVRS